MSALTLSLVAFVVIFGGALLGMLLRAVLPEPHLNADSKDVVRLGTGLLATLAALVIGLLIASAQSSFQTKSNQIKQITECELLTTIGKVLSPTLDRHEFHRQWLTGVLRIFSANPRRLSSAIVMQAGSCNCAV